MTTRIVITIPGPPVAKGRPRMTRKGRAYTPAKTRAAEDRIREAIRAQAGEPLLEGALSVTVLAMLPIPASWPRRKQDHAAAGIVRPISGKDVDNLAKLAMDAANGLLWRDDAQIVHLAASKTYSPKPGTVLTVEPAP